MAVRNLSFQPTPSSASMIPPEMAVPNTPARLEPMARPYREAWPSASLLRAVLAMLQAQRRSTPSPAPHVTVRETLLRDACNHIWENVLRLSLVSLVPAGRGNIRSSLWAVKKNVSICPIAPAAKCPFAYPLRRLAMAQLAPLVPIQQRLERILQILPPGPFIAPDNPAWSDSKIGQITRYKIRTHHELATARVPVLVKLLPGR